MNKILQNGFDLLGVDYTQKSLSDFNTFAHLLQEQNKVMNLTAISGTENIARLHFLDCAALLGFYNFKNKSVIDIGTGAGFPGVPIKLLMPESSITLLDSQKKRISFLKDVCSTMGLEGVSCIHARAEEYLSSARLRESFDIAVSRAVAHMSLLCELCLPYVKVGGCLIAMKGPDCHDELSEALGGIELLGGARPRYIPYNIPGTDITHCAVIVEKIKNTPAKYPRRFAKIQKSPL